MTRFDDLDRALRDARPPNPSAEELREATGRVLARFDARLDARPDDVEDVLRAARPASPSGADADEAARRVLARVRMLASSEGTAPARRRRISLRVVARVAAAIVIAVVLTQGLGHRPLDDPMTPEEKPICDALTTCVEDAIGGDALARHRVLTAGPRARTVLLTRAEQTDPGAVEALGLLRAMGGIRRDDEALRLRDLARRAATREPAIDLLASAPTAAGARHLGALLAEEGLPAAHIVQHLLAVAQRGRRTAALDALLQGAAAGRVEAAVAAFGVARATALERLLASLPANLLEHPEVAAAVHDAPVTTRDRLVRRAVAGDARALRLAVAADLDGVAPVLRAEALGGSETEAGWAVDALAKRGDLRSWLALVEAQDGAAGPEAQVVLRAMPDAVVAELERRAHREPARRREWLVALGAAGRRGALVLGRLAAEPALRAPAIDALERSPGPAAVHALAALADGHGESDRVLRALGRRLALGDETAGRALLGLARTGTSRRALRLLERHVAGAGRSWILETLTDDTLPATVRAALVRAAGSERRREPAPGVRANQQATPRSSPSPIT